MILNRRSATQRDRRRTVTVELRSEVRDNSCMSAQRRPSHATSLALSLIPMLLAWSFPSHAAEETVAAGRTPGERGLSSTWDWTAEQTFWSFQPPTRHSLPDVEMVNWLQRPIDAFVLKRLESAGHAPTRPATRRVWLRRVSYDLTGLPPSPAQVDGFLADDTPGAFERVVDRLLASPHYGERWTSLWLNIARYGENQGHNDGKSISHPKAYRYREWLIDAFNADMPYTRFVQLQLAADAIPGGGDQLPALGFIGLAPQYYDRKSLAVLADEWEDRVDTTTRGLLGLTVACARCHDHKYDPIAIEDYYALAGIFASTVPKNLKAKPSEETAVDDEGAAKKKKDPPTLLHIVEDKDPRDLHVFLRGNPERQGAIAPRRFLRVLSSGEPDRFAYGSGRLELARALTDRANPLTARVLVNRIWEKHFGRGLVSTPSNFGALGERPTHPQLLDDLAVRFMDNSWSIKWLQREILLSSTYRQSSTASQESVRADPDNRWLGRMPRRRLEVEAWRDSVLTAAGMLEPRIGGTSAELSDLGHRRRTVYGVVRRSQLEEILKLFDFPDPNVHSASRSVTTTAPQKLYLLNNPFVVQSAQHFAARILAGAQKPPAARIRQAYRQAYSRKPDAEELAWSLDFLLAGEPQAGADEAGEPNKIARKKRWELYSQTLLAANEFFFID